MARRTDTAAARDRHQAARAKSLAEIVTRQIADHVAMATHGDCDAGDVGDLAHTNELLANVAKFLAQDEDGALLEAEITSVTKSRKARTGRTY